MSKNHDFSYMINQAKAEARNDAIKTFFMKYRKIIKNLLLVFFIFVIGYIAVSVYQKAQQERYSQVLHQSLLDQQSGDIEKTKEALKSIYDSASAPSGIKALASLRYADIFLQEGKISKASEIYQDVSECRSCDTYIRELAGLLAIKSWIADENELKKDDILINIEKIESKTRVLKYHVLEQQGTVEMLKGELEKSYKTFDSIVKSPEAPKVVKARSSDALKKILEKGFDPNNPASKNSSKKRK